MPMQKAGAGIALGLVLALCSAAQASTEAQPELLTPDIHWWSIDSGAAVMRGGSFELAASLGQADAHTTRSGGSYELSPGFWPALQATGLPLPEPIFKNGWEN